MKKSKLVCLLLAIILFAPLKIRAQEYFSLEMALAKVEAHQDYKNWLKSLETAQESLETILNKQKAQIELSGQPFSYTYNINRASSQIVVAPALSYSKRFLSGTSLSASASTSKDFSKDSDWQLRWNLSLSQSLWPSPKLSADNLNLSQGEKTLYMLMAQRDYVLEGALYKIEELYRNAQLVEARVQFAQKNLQNEEESYRINQEKKAIGETSPADEIAAQIGILRAQKELEQAKINAYSACKRLQDALAIKEEIILPPLELDLESSLPHLGEGLSRDLSQHPLVLNQLLAIERGQAELLAAEASLRPDASLALGLSETAGSGDLQVNASLRVGYTIYDGQQKKSSLEKKAENLNSLLESYKEELFKLEGMREEGLKNIESMTRDLEIAELTLTKVNLEYEAALAQYEYGLIDEKTLEKQELQVLQSQLNYWEAKFNYGIYIRRLESNIFGDLPGGGTNR